MVLVANTKGGQFTYMLEKILSGLWTLLWVLATVFGVGLLLAKIISMA